MFRRGPPLCGSTSESVQNGNMGGASKQFEDESVNPDETAGLKRRWHESSEGYDGKDMGGIIRSFNKKARPELNSSSQESSEEGYEEYGDDDANSEDEMADLTSESHSEDSEESYDDNELTDLPESGERICLCKSCEKSWGNDSMRVAYGLLISPTKNPNQYLRVGVFSSFPLKLGGLGYFLRFPQQSVEVL